MLESTPTPNAQAPAVSEQPGSEFDAVAAFAQREQGEEPKTDEPEPADEPAEDLDTEADEADPDAEPEAEELVEVELGGATYKVPPEVQKAVLRQADYSRKMNEVGEKGKAFDERMAQAEAAAESAEKRADALAEVRTIDAQIKQYEGVDWAKARAENPADAAFAAVELLALQDKRRDAVQKAANVARELTETRNKLLNDQRNEMDAVLQKELKGWGDDLGKKLTEYARANKVQEKTLRGVTDPAIVIALNKARLYDALQSAKVALKGKAIEAPKVVKPGAPRKADPKADVMTRLRAENTQEAAEAAFLSRM